MPKRSRKVLRLSEKVNILDLMRKKTHMLKLLQCTVRTNLLSVILSRRRKKFVLVCLHTRPESVTFSTQLNSVPCVLEPVSVNLGMASETSWLKCKWCLQDRYTRALWLSHMQQEGTWPGLPCAPSVGRWCSAGGGHPYSRPLDPLGNLLGSTERTAEGVPSFCGWQCHCDS